MLLPVAGATFTETGDETPWVDHGAKRAIGRAGAGPWVTHVHWKGAHSPLILVRATGLKMDLERERSVPVPVSDSGSMDRDGPAPYEMRQDMARVRKFDGDLDTIASERAKLQERMAELDAAERAAREAQRDAGRGVLLAALERVKIGAMDRAQAREIAVAIGKLDTAELLRRIGEV